MQLQWVLRGHHPPKPQLDMAVMAAGNFENSLLLALRHSSATSCVKTSGKWLSPWPLNSGAAATRAVSPCQLAAWTAPEQHHQNVLASFIHYTLQPRKLYKLRIKETRSVAV